MYSDDDLSAAVDRGIFSGRAVADFRSFVDGRRHSTAVDEEQFRLVSGFNDIFVVLIGMLLMYCLAWIANSYDPLLAAAVFPVVSWGLSEVYVRRRRMALPAVVFLVTYTFGMYSSSMLLFSGGGEDWFVHENTYVVMGAALFAALGAWAHWWRFRVPITIAAGVGMALLAVVVVVSNYVDYRVVMFVGGAVVLGLAMYWDMSDVKRVTRRSDVAFWLHLLAAPMIVHPVFTALDVFGDPDVVSSAVVVVLYVFLSLVSLAINRRSLMVASLLYVLFAIYELLSNYDIGAVEHFAVTGVIISLPLLVLAAQWHAARAWVMELVPDDVCRRLPPLAG